MKKISNKWYNKNKCIKYTSQIIKSINKIIDIPITIIKKVIK